MTLPTFDPGVSLGTTVHIVDSVGNVHSGAVYNRELNVAEMRQVLDHAAEHGDTARVRFYLRELEEENG